MEGTIRKLKYFKNIQRLNVIVFLNRALGAYFESLSNIPRKETLPKIQKKKKMEKPGNF